MSHQNIETRSHDNKSTITTMMVLAGIAILAAIIYFANQSRNDANNGQGALGNQSYQGQSSTSTDQGVTNGYGSSQGTTSGSSGVTSDPAYNGGQGIQSTSGGTGERGTTGTTGSAGL